MPLLGQLRAHVEPHLLESMALVGVQHLFETTASFFDELISAGLDPDHTHVLGKSYSAVSRASEHLVSRGIRLFVPEVAPSGNYHPFQRQCAERWLNGALGIEAKHEGLIILDEGGDMLRAVASARNSFPTTCGVEQTRSGLGAVPGLEFSVIQVADSALKRFLEPPIIAKEVLSAVSVIPAVSRCQRVGIVGVGSLGSSLAKLLQRKGREVLLYDKSPVAFKNSSERLKGTLWCESLQELLSKADVVFGCTGSDVLSDVEWATMDSLSAKHFISCSSGDVEFRSLLEKSASQEARSGEITDVPVAVGQNTMTVYNGGYPINFNRACELSSAGDIQLTRALLLGGVFQAAETLRQGEHRSGGVMLCPDLQMFIAKSWFALHPELRAEYDADVLDGVESRDWIVENSGGTEMHAYARAGITFQ